MNHSGDILRREKAILENLLGEEEWWDAPGDMIGPYTLVERLGEGGFGVVWRALQTEPVRREVALKVVKPGMDTVQVLARFERERQVLAGMEHPNIAVLHDASATPDGRPCFAMELVEGEPVTHHCQRRGLSVQEKLELFLQVCGAVQHAHQKGVIHRDLKPPNILVVMADGKAVPKVIDFGISKLMNPGADPGFEATLLTRQDALMGTPLYMSPEQLSGALDVDTRSDIYSLGVILYELLAGQSPFDIQALLSQGAEEMRRALREDRPLRPSTVLTRMAANGAVEKKRARPRGRMLPADLDWIVMRALEKDRARRYSSAAEFASDVRRFLLHEPVAARPPSLTYLAACWARRHRALAAAACISLAALFSGLALALWQAREARLAQQRAEHEAARSLQTAAFLTALLDDVAAQVKQGRNPEALRGGLASSEARLDDIPDMDLRIALLGQISDLYDSMSERKLTVDALARLAGLTRERHGEASPEAHQAGLRHMQVMVNHGERGEAVRMLNAWRGRIEARQGRGSAEWFDVQHLLTRALVKLRSDARLAVLAAEEGLSVAAEHGTTPTKHLMLMLIHVEALQEAGRHEDALRQLFEAREMLARENLLEVFGLDVKRRIATAMTKKGNHAGAAALQREIVQEMARSNNPRLFKEYGYLVDMECKAREYESAVAHAREALALARAPGEDGSPRRAEVSDSLGFLADALSASGRHDEAVQAAREALVIAYEDGNGERISNAHVSLAGRLERAGRLDEAHAARGAAYTSHADRNASFKNCVYDLHAMAGIRKKQGRHAEALAHYQEAWRLCQTSRVSESDPDFLPYVARPALQCWKSCLVGDPMASPPPELAEWEAALNGVVP